jgi:hypothetical protein
MKYKLIFNDLNAKTCTGSSEKKLKVHLNEFATKGLRTLILARRRLSKIELDSFLEKWNKAQNSMVARDELLEEAASMVENDFTILGATAIEDKLQDEGEVIDTMTRCFIDYVELCFSCSHAFMNVCMCLQKYRRQLKHYASQASNYGYLLVIRWRQPLILDSPVACLVPR